MNKNIFIGLAWPYVNGDYHLGHLAGYLIPADIFNKYNRIKGNSVLLVSGSDCHGTPTTVQAEKEGVTPEDIVKKYHPRRIELMKEYNIELSLYTKTTEINHKEVVQQMFIELMKNGYITKEYSDQYFSEIDNKFLPDRYVEGECPHCHAKEQRSDQCEACGRMLSQGELINPVSKISKNKVIIKKSEHYFLDLQKLQNEILNYFNNVKENHKDWVVSELLGWLKEGLQKRAITRDLDWGITIPKNDISENMLIENIENKRIYVWFEAVIGYLSASIEWSKEDISLKDKIYKFDQGQIKNYELWWKNKDAKHYYFMGQDNLVFHTIMWPGMLIGAGKDYNLPDICAVNKFFNYEGKKFSKSRNWIIDAIDFGKKYNRDCIRFYIARVLTENKEGDFRWNDFIDKVNNELVSKIGNLYHRSLTFAYTKYEGKVNKKELDIEVKKKIKDTFSQVEKYYEKVELSKALIEIMNLVDYGNKYFDNSQIWHLIKENYSESENKMYNILFILDNLSVLLYPYISDYIKTIRGYMNSEEIIYTVGKDYHKYQEERNYKITKPEIILTHIEKIMN